MLVLSRRAGEVITIGEGSSKVVLRILSTHPQQVKIGIEAPREVKISHREEKDPTQEFSEGILDKDN